MTVGFPGTGIGGLFYVLVALLMPIRNLWLSLGKRRAEWGAVSRLFLLALAVVLGIFITGWLLGFLLSPAMKAIAIGSGRSDAISQPAIQNAVRLAALYASLSMLLIILLGVQVARLFVRKKS